MVASLNSLSEQIARLYSRQVGRETVKVKEVAEIKPLVVQAINKVLSLTQKDGMGDIPNCMIATYNPVTVQNSGSDYWVDLPAQPIKLPMNQGVWQVKPSLTGATFIPIPDPYWELLRSLDEGAIEGQIGFFQVGSKVYFTANPIVSEVALFLLVVDPASAEGDDVLPLSADLVEDVKLMVLDMLKKTGQTPE